MGDFIVISVLIIITVLIIVSAYKKKKNGGHCAGCSKCNSAQCEYSRKGCNSSK